MTTLLVELQEPVHQVKKPRAVVTVPSAPPYPLM